MPLRRVAVSPCTAFSPWLHPPTHQGIRPPNSSQSRSCKPPAGEESNYYGAPETAVKEKDPAHVYGEQIRVQCVCPFSPRILGNFPCFSTDLYWTVGP